MQRSSFIQPQTPIFLIQKMQKCSINPESSYSLFTPLYTNKKEHSLRKVSDACSVDTNCSFSEESTVCPKITTNYFEDFEEYQNDSFEFKSSIY